MKFLQEKKMYIFISFIIVLFLLSPAFALKCDKCHRDDKSLDKIFLERGVKNKEELLYKLKNGQKAKLHQHLTDEEINEAVKQMNLK